MRFFLPIFFFSNILCSQIIFKNDWVNKRTDQWLSFSEGQHSAKTYNLITKTKNEIDVRRLKIPDTQEDSLKNVGFKRGVTLIDKSKKLIPSIELESISLETISGHDSIFKFRYKIALRNKKQQLLGERFIARMGDDKSKVYKALKDHLYRFSTHKVKGTSIICVELSSDNLLFPDTKYKPGVFSYAPDFYF